MPLLFQPIQFGDLNLTNKIVIAPMCQYSANDAGELSYWHEQQSANYDCQVRAYVLLKRQPYKR